MTSPKKLKFDHVEISEGIGHLQEIDFTRKSRWTDLQLKVEGKDLYVPKSHLALLSPVFRLMFESDFQEKDLDVLPLPGKKYEDVLTFLKCTHPGALVKVTYNIVSKVLPLAHEYQVQWLLDDCTLVLLMEMPDSSFGKKKSAVSRAVSGALLSTNSTSDLYTKWCNICIMAEKYDLSCVVERFIERFSSLNYKWYKDLNEFKKISIEVRYRIVCERLDSKEDVYMIERNKLINTVPFRDSIYMK